MKRSFIIELKIGEFIDRHSAWIDSTFWPLDFRNFIEEFLEEGIGGMLCIDDCHIPEIIFFENGQKFRLEIACCCENQCLQVENRLSEILK
jgi:hypothetical protein